MRARTGMAVTLKDRLESAGSAQEAINEGFENHLNFQHKTRVFTSQERYLPHRKYHHLRVLSH